MGSIRLLGQLADPLLAFEWLGGLPNQSEEYPPLLAEVKGLDGRPAAIDKFPLISRISSTFLRNLECHPDFRLGIRPS